MDNIKSITFTLENRLELTMPKEEFMQKVREEYCDRVTDEPIDKDQLYYLVGFVSCVLERCLK